MGLFTWFKNKESSRDLKNSVGPNETGPNNQRKETTEIDNETPTPYRHISQLPSDRPPPTIGNYSSSRSIKQNQPPLPKNSTLKQPPVKNSSRRNINVSAFPVPAKPVSGSEMCKDIQK